MRWKAPRWSYLGKIWRELRQVVFSRGPLMRITAASTISCVVIALLFKWMMPQINLWMAWPIVFALPFMLLYLLLFLGLHYLFQPLVVVKPEKVSYSFGQSVIHIEMDSVESMRLIFHHGDRIRLVIHYWNENLQRLVIGVPPELDFEKLQDLLTWRAEVIDARQRAWFNKYEIKNQNDVTFLNCSQIQNAKS